ncbi:surface lipoprotein assembly modifier [Actinobacillus equuli subsp. equuli]|uniref:porin family protein n=1 Tax=Actinobacillus equuli TaxID=718 RepID=UPI0024422778|nr:porin family protein [Actinobacillus equuli]WGE55059.1 surface lipoprotein assembly modifier [Actinobacillus equuli subsp. equuli]
MKLKLLISTLAVSTAFSAFANTTEQQISEHLNDLRSQTEVAIESRIQKPVARPISQPTVQQKKLPSMSKEEFAKRPDLISNALIVALHQSNPDTVSFLYSFYTKLPSQYQDPIVVKWSEAILARHKGNHDIAITNYREVLAEYSDLGSARLQLAMALFENNELEAAEDQFQKIRSENPPSQIKDVVDQYIDAIANKDRWTFSGGFTYLNDPNINNAPKSGTTYGQWSAPKSESAQGIGFNFYAGKKWSWGNNFYNEFRLSSNGKYYWNNKKYNEASVRGSFGLGYQTSRFNVAMLPFMEQTLYAGGSSSNDSLKRFSKTGGAILETTYWLSSKWQWESNYEYAEQRYMSRKHLNGNYHFISSGLTYLASAKQYWFGNINYNRTATRDKDDSYIRRGITLGWAQEWPLGLSTRLSINYAQKNYKAPMPIFGITQRNKEYGASLSLWHRAVHYWGITPRLTYSFNKVKSNHVFYSYDKHRAFVEFSKRF